MTGEGELAGRVAVVTGALGRLGPVWTGVLTRAGATVVGIDLQEGGAQEGVQLLRADVTDRDALRDVLERVRSEYGRVPAVLVNNAGIDQPPDASAQTQAIED